MENDVKISFKNNVYNQSNVDTVLDRAFSTFGVQEPETEVSITDKIRKFFADYDELYYSIPAEGDTESHQYLVEKSSALYSSTELMDSLQPLINEITLLRQQNTSYQQSILDLQIKNTELTTELSKLRGTN